MEYLSYIAVIFFLIFLAKRFLFAADKEKVIENIPKNDYLQEKPEIQKIEAEIEEEEEEKIEEIFYELNTHDIKISLYSASTFSNYKMRNIYEKIIVKNYWIDEPFHSSFVKILYCISENDFWIKSLKSKEIIINFRDLDDKELRDTALHVLDLREVLCDVIVEVDRCVHRFLTKQDTYILLLSSMIYTISKCGNLNTLLEKKDDDIDMLALLIEIFCIEFSEEIKNKIIPTNNINLNLIEKVYNAAIERAKEYPNYLGDNSAQKKEIKMLQNLQQKRLLTVRDY